LRDAEDKPKGADSRKDARRKQRGRADHLVLLSEAQTASDREQTPEREQTSPSNDAPPSHDAPPTHDALRAAHDREQAKEDRARAANDRQRATEERAQSAHDRALAAQDRAQAALDREASENDDLTHVLRRGPGMQQLQREIDRAHRASEELIVTFIDVDGLKAVNDTQGHLAGDLLLIAVADSLRKCLRSYDVVMRYGGDEFVCAMPNADADDVGQRFADVSTAIAAGPIKCSITVGFAELGEDHSAEDLIRRADADLLARRGRR
jgi:diguanylate cyclase (GGDEF)-like protein